MAMRRTRQRLLLTIIVVLAVGIVTSLVVIARLIWYDQNPGRIALPLSGTDDPQNLGLPPLRNSQADIQRTRRTVKSDGFLGLCLARFQRRAERYPTRLEELLERPPDLGSSRWDGPYVSSPDVLTDPWGKAYRYGCPGIHNPTGYDLWSVGPDGVDGTGDDIGNW
jgi:type II secretory pathway pseudopilin PulG